MSEMSFLRRVYGLTLRFQMQCSDIREVEMVYASGQDIFGMSSSKGVSVHVKLGRDPKQIQHAGLGMPWGTP